jgi:predicted methyltransferase
MYKTTFSAFALSVLLFNCTVVQAEPTSLAVSINSSHRSDDNRLRDVYRYPRQTLDFFGVTPEMTVVEVWPGKGWYTEILAPYLREEGSFIAAGFPLHEGPKWRQTMQQNYLDWLAESPSYYDRVKVVELGPPTKWNIGQDNSVDAVLTFRNVHNWLKGGYESEMFTAFYKVLKPGGILGVIDHRADSSADIESMKQSGYLSQELVIDLAKKAGFVLEASSEVNANPRDSKDYPKGVWTLPPTLRLGDQNKAHYKAIGESDRMTLRFRKPKS